MKYLPEQHTAAAIAIAKNSDRKEHWDIISDARKPSDHSLDNTVQRLLVEKIEDLTDDLTVIRIALKEVARSISMLRAEPVPFTMGGRV